MIKNILITGIPGIGKTTLIKKLSEELKNLNPVGFYTTEIREEGIRKGFELISLDGKRNVLSHTNLKSPFRVGKYRVNIDGFENFLKSIPFLSSPHNLIIIDEIGKMECYSNIFRKFITKILDSNIMFIATIAVKGDSFIEDIKRRSDIKLFEITTNNRDFILSEIVNDVKISLQFQ